MRTPIRTTTTTDSFPEITLGSLPPLPPQRPGGDREYNDGSDGDGGDGEDRRGRHPLVKLLVDYNPFYFLSACCMLLGIFVLNDSLDWSPLPQQNLLLLITALNVYELALLGLGLFLLKRGLARDALFLLLLEAFFLADAGSLNMELFTSDPLTGLLVNTLLLALAACKVGAVFWVVGLRPMSGLYAFVMLQVAVLFAMPGVFADVALRRGGELPELTTYAAWWVLGALPVAYLLLAHRSEPVGPTPRFVARSFLILPAVSLLAHLCLAHWVHEVRFHLADLAPLLLGLAVVIGRFDAHVSTLQSRMRLGLALPFTAIALAAVYTGSKSSGSDLVMYIGGPGGMSISPLRLTLLGAALVYLDGWWLHRSATFAWAAGAALIAAGMGPSVRGMFTNLADFLRFARGESRRFVPTTSLQWGVTSIVTAFVLLAVGTAFSLMRGSKDQKKRGFDVVT